MFSRLVIYYPVSALVTLFANILQNPQDSRARSDLKLMNLVVSFLGLLCSDEENGSVRRMLSVCAEFERIAKVVLEKAEKENSTRRKRKQQTEQDAEIAATAREILTPEYQTRQSQSRGSQGPNQQLPHGSLPSVIPGTFTSEFANNFDEPFPFSPDFTHASLNNTANLLGGFSSPSTTNQMLPTTTGGLSDLSFNTNQQNPNGDMNGMSSGMSPNGTSMHNPLDMSTFQHPFVPQDLWKMPMTLEWDWADMTGYSAYEDGISMNGVLSDLAEGSGSNGVNGVNGHQHQNHQGHQGHQQ